MRYMIIVKADAESEAGHLPSGALRDAIVGYHRTLAEAGVLLDANGLKPSSDGWRLRWRAGRREVVDGPFAETKELIAGYTVIQVRDRAEAMEWARRFPAPLVQARAVELEVRPLYEPGEAAAQAAAD